jgi:hypothetical protein
VILLVFAALAIVWYVILITLIGWLTGAWPCKDCAREKLRRRGWIT